LFLDRELNIRRYTEHMTKLIKLRPTDLGRPFTEMRSDLQYANIAEDASEVLRTLMFNETDVATKDNRWFTVRIMPYRTLDDRIDGLVITFIEITTAKRLESELKETIRILKEHNIYKP
jgi:two-component system, chemotaxis family, CheB/CheR fusion protein